MQNFYRRHCKEEVLYEDISSEAIYGYLSIDSISESNIKLTFTKVSSDNTKFSQQFSIDEGQTADLDEDGNPDLKYAKPVITRTGYANARWLTFICSEEDCSTAMFYTFTKSAARAGYRATSQEAEMIEPGLYGVNTSNNFIFIQYGKEKPSSLAGMAYGDYVVSLPNDNPTIEITDAIAAADDKINVKDIEFDNNGVPTSEPQSKVDVEFYGVYLSSVLLRPANEETKTAERWVNAKDIAMTIDVGFNPYAEVKVWKFKLRKDFANVPLLKHKVRFYPTPVQWMRQ